MEHSIHCFVCTACNFVARELAGAVSHEQAYKALHSTYVVKVDIDTLKNGTDGTTQIVVRRSVTNYNGEK